jgi:peptidoglycan/LPS O-acetylase OafA/YrhL
MNGPFSIYLDLVRFVAALLVFVYHSNQRLLVQEPLPVSNYGHSAVIVFFVLSGFVIAFVTDTKEKDWRAYTASRLSRVYSVALPAIALTLCLDAIGRHLYPAFYQQYPWDQHLVRAFISLLMLNEVWFLSVTSYSNVPYWSITFEIWYYVAFGLLTFLPARWAWAALLGLALLLGPKLLLLAPIWWLGVFLYRSRRLRELPLPWAWLLLVVSVVGIVVFHVSGLQDVVKALFKGWLGVALYNEFTFAKFFLTDYLLAILVAMNFVAMSTVAPATARLWRAIEMPVRAIAAYTFTLYLLHQPLFLFWGAVLRWSPDGYAFWLAITLLTGASVWAIGLVTETRRHGLRVWILSLLQRVGSGSASSPGLGHRR